MIREYARWQKTAVMKALDFMRVVIVSGPRQCGKTTLARQIGLPDELFRTLDDGAMRRLAAEDPHGFVKHANGTMIIDEIQKAPQLLPAIKMAVDSNNERGQFLLTGSANLSSLPEVTESLAGRVANIHLRPLSIGEILRREPVFLQKAFAKDFPAKIKGYDREIIVRMAFRGGFPEALHMSGDERKAWHINYISALLERDLADIANIRRKGAIRETLEILAAWSGKFMDIAGMCGKVPIAKSTFETYENFLEAMFLFERLRPWIRTDYDRVGRRYKLYAADTGLMACVLGWRIDEVLLNPDKSGKLVETFVFNELSAQVGLKYDYALFQYRDRAGREIDFIVEDGRGALLGIEVKAGSMVSKDDFRHMYWFRENIASDREFIGVVLYTGENTLPFGNNMFALPVAALWV